MGVGAASRGDVDAEEEGAGATGLYTGMKLLERTVYRRATETNWLKIKVSNTVYIKTSDVQRKFALLHKKSLYNT